MIPLRDENPTHRFPVITIMLIVLNVIVFFYETSLAPEALQAFFTEWSFVASRFFAAPTSPQQVATVFTSMFMHAGWVHIGGNMLYLWIFGNNVEDRLGRIPFLIFYLACGVVGVGAQALIEPASTIPTLGASGAIAGVLGGYALLFPGAAVLTLIPIFFFFEIARVPAFIVIGFWFVLQLASGVASVGPSVTAAGGVAYFAHLGGFAAGLALTVPLWFSDRFSRRARGGRY
ncbi:MAG: rhomboid family intramembrane serine protease [Coriobacteriia bacterium]|nr:rhomboid family intramembrane serine protease [Coriobacteriia bacterium]MBN2823230.1 rhomboid family intramembrane serine protease [Coriobacteriia bacterium]